MAGNMERGGCSRKDKKRETKIIRTMMNGGDKWVDQETLYNADYGGSQWEGPDQGNQPQETIQTPNEDCLNEGGDIAEVNFPKGKKDKKEHKVNIKNKSTIQMKSRNNVDRKFNNKQPGKPGGNTCRNSGDDGCRKRIAFNYIDKSFLDRDGNPPSGAKDYREAVKKTGDQADFWLDVEIPKSHKQLRNKRQNGQAINYDYTWECGKIDLPGSSDNIDQSEEDSVVRTDPFRVAINFGPDFMGVTFSKGGGDPPPPAEPASSGGAVIRTMVRPAR